MANGESQWDGDLSAILAVLDRESMIHLAKTRSVDLPDGYCRKSVVRDALLRSPRVHYDSRLLPDLRKQALLNAAKRLGLRPKKSTKREAIKVIHEAIPPGPVQPSPTKARRVKYSSFTRARTFARKLGLSSPKDWKLWVAGKVGDRLPRPRHIPVFPQNVYHGKGWRGWPDFLGYERVSPARRKLVDFEEAQDIARCLGFQNSRDWRLWANGKLPGLGRRPFYLPADPRCIYRDSGWVSWGAFLGTGRRRTDNRRYVSFAKARAIARKQGLRSGRSWRRWVSGRSPDRPDPPAELPPAPNETYRDQGWAGWADFLGESYNPRRRLVCRPFEEARSFARELGLSGQVQWRAWCRGDVPELPPRPQDLPTRPEGAYGGSGWAGWRDFLGNEARADRGTASYEEARAIARCTGVSRSEDWLEWGRGARPELGTFPSESPRRPFYFYANHGWAGWPDFLGLRLKETLEALDSDCLEALLEVYGLADPGPDRDADQLRLALLSAPEVNLDERLLGLLPLANLQEIAMRAGVEARGPARASLTAAILEQGRRISTMKGRTFKRHTYRPFEDARRLARSLFLRCSEQWYQWIRGRTPHLGPAPDDVPTHPDRAYRKRGWTDWFDFLGTTYRMARNSRFRPLLEAKDLALNLGIQRAYDYERWRRGQTDEFGPRPEDMPALPENAYKHSGWTTWQEFLSSDVDLPLMPFTEAREFARGLGLTSVREWAERAEGKRGLTERVPLRPDFAYRSEDWQGWPDWLGFEPDREQMN
ncbi:MAG: hypothetical protein ACYTGV_09930 [Planctomycetota bacterium]|jgi:hypothetical protein